MKGQRVPAPALLMPKNWDEWLIHQKAMLPVWKTWIAGPQAERSLLEFSKCKFRVLNLGKNNPRHSADWGMAC